MVDRRQDTKKSTNKVMLTRNLEFKYMKISYYHRKAKGNEKALGRCFSFGHGGQISASGAEHSGVMQLTPRLLCRGLCKVVHHRTIRWVKHNLNRDILFPKPKVKSDY